jgi:hypothetical protein
VTLTGPAAAGAPVVVELTTANRAIATVPGSITVAPGTTTATFTVETRRVTGDSSFPIGGNAGGAIRTATLTVRR